MRFVRLAPVLTRPATVVLGLSLLASACAPKAMKPPLPTVEAAAHARAEELIRQSGAEVAVAFRTLDGRSEWFARDTEPFHAASTMKVPVMI
jgi:beta-lactamase class A